ncbi:MAG: murein L,D-transpeptidase catalytic domain family protein [Bacteroidetes bacterium]|jgi:hypothetical protein|nr:murein L,D-transpeptidase catalytic domain family protein [Bacteroidota bacterium]
MPFIRLPLLIILTGLLGCQTPHHPKVEEGEKLQVENPYSVNTQKLEAAKAFCKQNGFNEGVAFFSDMNLRSGKKRFFIVDLSKDSVVHAGLVAHGHCRSYASRVPSFSNEIGSNCTSLGKYKVGYKYDGSFGTAYKLYGLEPSNSNAFDRFVVLHAHSCVPNSETVVGICRSEGCPTVSPEFLEVVSEYIDETSQPILLWMYNG